MSNTAILIGALAGAAAAGPATWISMGWLSPRMKTIGGLGAGVLTGLFVGAATALTLDRDYVVSTLTQKQFIQKCRDTAVPVDYETKTLRLPGGTLTCRMELKDGIYLPPPAPWQRRPGLILT